MDEKVLNEVIAYEYLWSLEKSNLRKISEQLVKPKLKPTQIIQNDLFSETNIPSEIIDYINSINSNYSVLFYDNPYYSTSLFDVETPVPMFYYKGNINLLKTPLISIVGTRNMTFDGASRAAKISKLLSNKGYTIVSGLAKGIDTIALETAVKNNKPVIAVIGTPLNEYYPKENKKLQDYISDNCLLLSQVPFYKYSKQPFQTKRFYFPERDVTMAALSKATIVVEASDHSGTLIQARACMKLNKPLFILNSCFENNKITWPKYYESKGAYRVKDISDIINKMDS